MRIDYRKVLPGAVDAMSGLDEVVRGSAVEPELLELVRTRASQLNGCAYSLDMHSKDARARAPLYSERERAALAWCEALTLLPQTGAPDDVYADVESHLDVGLRSPVGDHVSSGGAPEEVMTR